MSIAKALAGEATVLILDEPSAILTDAEIDVLFDVVRRLTASGVAVIYISHRLDELFRIADEVTVMRDGQTIGTYPIGELVGAQGRRAHGRRHPVRRAAAPRGPGRRRPRSSSTGWAARASSTT